MRTINFLMIICTFFASCGNEVLIPAEDISFPIPENNHLGAESFQDLLDTYSAKGLVGVTAIVDSPEGFWAGSSGMAGIETNTRMTIYHLHRSGSVPKMYTGTAIMMLKEQGLIDLDEYMKTYLPASIYSNITNGDIITVRQLLNHSSGLYDYTSNAQFYFNQLNNPKAIDYSSLELIEFLYGKPSEYVPGEHTTYSNSNFLLLAVIIDHVTGASHAEFFDEMIFKPLGLDQTYYKIHEGYPQPPGIVNAYADWKSNGKLINISDIYHYWNVMVGDDGMVASIYDYMRFTKALFEYNLVNQQTLQEMMDWNEFDSHDGQLIQTGLSIQYWQSIDQTKWGTGHRGATHGTGGYTFYFPESGTTITVFTNTGCERGIYGDLLDDLWNELVSKAID